MSNKNRYKKVSQIIMNKKPISIKWFPPSWLLIKAEDKIIYIDPAWIQKNFNSYPKKIIFSHYPERMDGLPEPDLPKADFILITHHHQDHVKTATIKRLATGKTKIYAPTKCAELIGQHFNEIKVDDKIIENGIKIKAVFAYNTPEGKSTRKVHHKGEGVGYLLTVNGKTIYHAGDTDFIPEMRGLGDVDVALLPIGGTFTMDIEEAIEAVVAIKPKIVIPMHYLKANPQEFKKKLEAKSNIKVIDLQMGEVYEL